LPPVVVAPERTAFEVRCPSKRILAHPAVGIDEYTVYPVNAYDLED